MTCLRVFAFRSLQLVLTSFVKPGVWYWGEGDKIVASVDLDKVLRFGNTDETIYGAGSGEWAVSRLFEMEVSNS